MFRKICMVISFFLATSSVFGQEFSFGIFVDPTITWLRADVKDVSRDRARLGIDVGMSVDYFFSQNYAFATGVSLFNMGGTLKYEKGITLKTKDGKVAVENDGTVKYKVQYIKIPAALKFKTVEIGNMTYFANLGLDPMVRVSARVNYDDVKNVNAIKETKLFNLGWHFGLGAQYSLGDESAIFGGLSFLNTFFDITKPAHDKITSNNLVLHIGIMF